MPSEAKSWWQDVASRFDEREALKQLDGRIAQQESALQLSGRLLALRGQPGFEAFLEALKGIREHALRELCAPGSSDQLMRVAQGKVLGYDNILAVMQRGEDNQKALDRGLSELREQRKLLERPTSKETR